MTLAKGGKTLPLISPTCAFPIFSLTIEMTIIIFEEYYDHHVDINSTAASRTEVGALGINVLSTSITRAGNDVWKPELHWP
ncbi:hypothetical protein J3P85_16000 [Pseudomonas sp. Z1-12]|uniref:hypothetical protein n=1 Tax=Pseudomonas sp. Z1-12 TaxID=2817408 RepID=UPI003DA9C894